MTPEQESIIRRELEKSKEREKFAGENDLISAEQAWRFRRFGIEWVLEQLGIPVDLGDQREQVLRNFSNLP